VANLNPVKDCCGITEIGNISMHEDPEDVLKDIYHRIINGVNYDNPVQYSRKRRPFFLFSGVTTRHVMDHASNRPDNYGQALEDYIRSHGLGKVVSTTPTKNWSGNDLKVWIWTADLFALEMWGKERGL